MKKLLLITPLLISFLGIAQVSTTRMNDIKLGMKLSELEKLTGQKIKLELNEYGYPIEDLTIVLNRVTYKVILDVSNGFYVYGVKSSDSTLKTLSGVKIGTSLDELISKYKDYNISISDSYDMKTDKRTKALRYFNIEDYDAGSFLKFNIVNGKVISFEIMYHEGC